MNDKFDPREAAKALDSSVRFFRDCHEMFFSLVDEIQSFKFDYAWLDHAGWLDKNGFEYAGRFIYRQCTTDPYQFVSTVVSPRSDVVKRASQAYQIICDQLGLDPRFPLLLAYGTFQVKDEKGFHDGNRLRNWCYNVFRLGVLDSEVTGDVSQYQFHQDIDYVSAATDNAYYCEGARFRIVPIWEIRNGEDVSRLANECRHLPGIASQGKRDRPARR